MGMITNRTPAWEDECALDFPIHTTLLQHKVASLAYALSVCCAVAGNVHGAALPKATTLSRQPAFVIEVCKHFEPPVVVQCNLVCATVAQHAMIPAWQVCINQTMSEHMPCLRLCRL
jgi:hypothetical protein